MKEYNPEHIESKWQRYWEEQKVFRTDESDTSRPKYFVLDMFPYPSSSGLHVGHPEGYTATDIIARYKRMNGYNVMHPIGWDAFGLPAEQYAVKTGTHPRTTTEKNIDGFRRQLKAIGFSYDWDREVDTTDPDYFKWTQWIFLQLYKHGLAYEADVPVNWCPDLGTVLANEEVIDGKSEVGGYPVYRKPMRQWMLRITAYADRLLVDLEDLDWPESIKEMQRNWIGRSEGADIYFDVKGLDEQIQVYTTRPDTLFGATYMVLSPEHPLIERLVTGKQRGDVQAYCEQASRKSEVERLDLNREKTGVDTGAKAINPATGQEVPVWIADYVLMGYGTGAIMAVPGHDERDWEFAHKYNLPVVEVVKGGDIQQGAFTETEQGTLTNSSNREISLDGLSVPDAIARVTEWLEHKGLGKRSVNYKLRDWLFSRQRYWGEPIPIIHVDGEPKPVPEDQLPVELPEVDKYKPAGTGESPLARMQDWVNTTDPETGKPARRETNTMPQWAGSCWYYLRYLSPDYDKAPVDPEKEKYWMPVDLYVGGAEHAVLHLLYARFWHKFLYDIGVVSTSEPFQQLVNQGMILGEMEYKVYKKDGSYVSYDQLETAEGLDVEWLSEDDVEKKGDWFVIKGTETAVEARAHKMSKSRGNVINPDDIIRDYGADSLRLYEMFMGPLEQVKPWSMRGVEGVYRYLKRVWKLIVDEQTGEPRVADHEPDRDQLGSLHRTIKKVTDDIESYRFNTAISALMIFNNEAMKWESLPRSVAETYVLLLSPFAPHLGEELWRKLSHDGTLAYEPWPEYDEQHLVSETQRYAVQVNGKVRTQIEVEREKAEDRDYVLSLAKSDENVQRYLDNGNLVKEIFVPNKIVNLVVKE